VPTKRRIVPAKQTKSDWRCRHGWRSCRSRSIGVTLTHTDVNRHTHTRTDIHTHTDRYDTHTQTYTKGIGRCQSGIQPLELVWSFWPSASVTLRTQTHTHTHTYRQTHNTYARLARLLSYDSEMMIV